MPISKWCLPRSKTRSKENFKSVKTCIKELPISIPIAIGSYFNPSQSSNNSNEILSNLLAQMTKWSVKERKTMPRFSNNPLKMRFCWWLSPISRTFTIWRWLISSQTTKHWAKLSSTQWKITRQLCLYPHNPSLLTLTLFVRISHGPTLMTSRGHPILLHSLAHILITSNKSRKPLPNLTKVGPSIRIKVN